VTANNNAPNVRCKTRRGLAEEWGVSERHIDNLIRTGKLPASRVGAAVRIRDIDADAYLVANRVAA